MAKFKGGGFGGGMPNMNNLMQQAQKMQAEMAKQQEALAVREFRGTAGGGAVIVIMLGDYSLKDVVISDEVMDDREMLQDLILVAFNDALKQVKYESEAGMKGLTGGLF
ncbi:MAG: YbaB/EbfC family nucleoid-associated protein [Oscillospiraceae bacterium]|nr:YbaB/EbfC family nucleoid-associated protein [Oscillospiraceae bacterium]